MAGRGRKQEAMLYAADAANAWVARPEALQKLVLAIMRLLPSLAGRRAAPVAIQPICVG